MGHFCEENESAMAGVGDVHPLPRISGDLWSVAFTISALAPAPSPAAAHPLSCMQILCKDMMGETN